MAVYVNRLAGVTSDGGFVVWELPEVITDDVPCVLFFLGVDRMTFANFSPLQWTAIAMHWPGQ